MTAYTALRTLVVIGALPLGACTHGPVLPHNAEALPMSSSLPPEQSNAGRDITLRPVIPDTASEQSSGCIAQDVTPAVYRTVMGEIQTVPARRDASGTLQPPIFRRGPVPELVRPASELSFPAPCPADITPQFIASLQRALAARGYFAGNVTGELDPPTAAAIRTYQSERGLDSAQVSLDTARELGLFRASEL